jgi:phospholipid transport system substrate-binding protein
MTKNIHQHQNLIKFLFGIFIIFFTALVSAENEQERAIQSPVIQLHESLLDIMKSANSSSYQERYALLEPSITQNFDTPLISKVILSRYWKSLDEKAQNDFIKLFNRLTISTYVSRFDSYDGELFKNISVEPMKKERFMVKTELLQTNEDAVSFNYIVQKDGEQWKIISVIANGINDLSLKRAEYTSYIKEHGYDALLQSLNEKIRDLESK